MFGGRVVGEGEPLWLPEDRDAAIAVWQEKQLTHSCGQPLDVSADPSSDGKYVAEPVVCHACAARDHASRAHAKDGDMAGVIWEVTRVG